MAAPQIIFWTVMVIRLTTKRCSSPCNGRPGKCGTSLSMINSKSSENSL